jgi:hypothetical protein
MLDYLRDIGLFTALVYAIVESLEKFGISKKYAHLVAIPIGIGISFLGFPVNGVMNKVFYGVIIGLLSVGTCDTACNAVGIFKDKVNK